MRNSPARPAQVSYELPEALSRAGSGAADCSACPYEPVFCDYFFRLKVYSGWSLSVSSLGRGEPKQILSVSPSSSYIAAPTTTPGPGSFSGLMSIVLGFPDGLTVNLAFSPALPIVSLSPANTISIGSTSPNGFPASVCQCGSQ